MKLILAGVLWLMAIAMITTAALVYFNGSQFLRHKREMWQMKNDGEE